MGLIENLSHGLQKSGVIPRIMRFLPLISALCAIIGFAWLFVFPMDGQYRNTYISENALMPHQASTHFRDTEWEITRAYLDEVNNLQYAAEPERNAELASLFREFGIKTAVSNWSSALPVGKFDRTEGASSGETLYGILHAPRGSSNEAIAVVAPWFNKEGSFNKGGVALLVALARYLARWSVWQKNLIFVLPTNSHVATRSWVEAYHTSLQYTAGSIEGAIVLDFAKESEYFSHIEVDFDGLNGQLPNLDLLNTVVRVADDEHVRSEILGMNMNYHLYSRRIETMFQAIKHQFLAGLVVGPGSEMFSGWRIDAVTIRARGEGQHDITTFGRVAEGTIRSINNLLEHFHQSFFFYLLMGPKQFISIGTFLPSAMLVANSFVIMAGYYLYNTPFEASDILPSVGVFAVIWTLSSLAGALAAYEAPRIFTTIFIYCNAVVQLYYFRTSISTSGLFLQYAISLTAFGLGCTMLATLNYSASMVFALVALPLAWVKPRAGWTRRNMLALFLSCPLVAWAGATLAMGVPYGGILIALIAAQREIGSWHWRLIHTLWLPLWLSALLAITPQQEIPQATQQEYDDLKQQEKEIAGLIN